MGLPFAATPPAAASTLLINDYGAFHRFSLEFRRDAYLREFDRFEPGGGPHWF
jgi:hypothetical protein